MDIEREKQELAKKIAETDDIDILKAVRIVLESEKKSTK